MAISQASEVSTYPARQVVGSTPEKAESSATGLAALWGIVRRAGRRIVVDRRADHHLTWSDLRRLARRWDLLRSFFGFLLRRLPRIAGAGLLLDIRLNPRDVTVAREENL